MSAESKLVETNAEGGAVSGSQDSRAQAAEAAEGAESGEEPVETVSVDDAPSSTATKKKKPKRKRAKIHLAGEGASSSGPGESSVGSSKLPSTVVDSLLRNNPSLQSEVGGMGKEKAEDLLRKLNVSDLLTGMVRSACPTLH